MARNANRVTVIGTNNPGEVTISTSEDRTSDRPERAVQQAPDSGAPICSSTISAFRTRRSALEGNLSGGLDAQVLVPHPAGVPQKGAVTARRRPSPVLQEVQSYG
jgi:hypothetical protein